MMNFFRTDFVNVRYALGELVGREVPLWIFIPYYVILGNIGFLMVPFIKLYFYIKFKIIVFKMFRD